MGKKIVVQNEQEIEMTPEQDAFCEGVSCRVQKNLETSGLVEKIAKQVKDEILKELEDVREVAKVHRAHPSFEDMKDTIEFERKAKEVVDDD